MLRLAMNGSKGRYELVIDLKKTPYFIFCSKVGGGIMRKLSFEFHRVYKPLLGRLVYRELEYSLDFVEYSVDDLDELSGDGGRTSLTVHTLQIEIGISTGGLLYPWG